MTVKKNKNSDIDGEALTDPNKVFLSPTLNKPSNFNSKSVSDDLQESSSILTSDSFSSDQVVEMTDEKMTEAPNYREMVERKNAVKVFDAYIQLLEVMIEMDPKLYKTAVRTLKKQKSFKLNREYMMRLKKLYPELLPNNVF